MKIFNIHIVSNEEYIELKRRSDAFQRLVSVHRWFSGWVDLDIIWEYIFNDTYFGGISDTREKYAKARNTGVYGEKK